MNKYIVYDHKEEYDEETGITYDCFTYYLDVYAPLKSIAVQVAKYFVKKEFYLSRVKHFEYDAQELYNEKIRQN